MQAESQPTTETISRHQYGQWQWDEAGLENLIEDLAIAGKVTEHGFLELGGNIKLFHGRAQDISRVAGQVLQLLHGDEGENTLQHLQLLVERFSLWLAATGEKSRQICGLLSHVVRQLADLHEPVAGLRKVVKTLHSLRVSTRIEAAKGYARGAGVLAKSLDDLGSQVHAKIAEIVARAETLGPLIDKSLSLEEAALTGASRIAGHEVQQARRLLSASMANCIETGRWTDRLKQRSDDVALNFGEMVAALQFQDITRQRIEHVQKALVSLDRHLERFDKRSDYSRDTEAARLFGRICRLQHGQLDLARREFLAAADNLSGNLHGMVDSVVCMAEDTRELSRATALGSDNRFAAVLEVLKKIAGHLDDSSRSHQSAGRYLAEVCREIQEVSRLVEEVELIGEEMQLLAMNAAISAAHAREHGAALDIIAQNIHDVAGEATGHALVLANECETITSHAANLENIGRETQTDAGSVKDLLGEARDHMTTIEGSNLKLMALATEVDRAAAALAGDVNKVVAALDVCEHFEEKLTPALFRLDALGTSLDEEITASDEVNLETLFRDLEHCYTMDSERRVHKHFVNGNDSSTPGAAAEHDQWSACRDHDLGDNVDLF